MENIELLVFKNFFAQPSRPSFAAKKIFNRKLKYHSIENFFPHPYRAYRLTG